MELQDRSVNCYLRLQSLTRGPRPDCSPSLSSLHGCFGLLGVLHLYIPLRHSDYTAVTACATLDWIFFKRCRLDFLLVISSQSQD